MNEAQTELARRIMRATPADGVYQPIKGLHLHRFSSTMGPVHGVTLPAFCVIAQGAKEVFLGEECYHYDPNHYLLTAIELPILSQLLGCLCRAPLSESTPGFRPHPGCLGHAGSGYDLTPAEQHQSARHRCQPTGP
ncbi:MAG: AraC family transcriptional regulator [Armatimonas sp.]